ncbi:MAG: aminotransferase, partial [Erysipelotrichaceae bacterium]|nr:aminotransferase [Erysipelotrichaceae bacterium]
KKKYIDKLREHNYSGGGQVQGPEASEILRSLVNVHALLGTQNLAVEETARRLNANEIQHVRKAVKANIEERILLVQLDLPIAKQVMEHAAKLGALPYPVGSESRFEVHTMFYRVSRTMMEKDPVFANYVIRINPMRAGADTVLRILDQSIKAVLGE